MGVCQSLIYSLPYRTLHSLALTYSALRFWDSLHVPLVLSPAFFPPPLFLVPSYDRCPLSPYHVYSLLTVYPLSNVVPSPLTATSIQSLPSSISTSLLRRHSFGSSWVTSLKSVCAGGQLSTPCLENLCMERREYLILLLDPIWFGYEFRWIIARGGRRILSTSC